jgi:hypothetical protein
VLLARRQAGGKSKKISKKEERVFNRISLRRLVVAAAVAVVAIMLYSPVQSGEGKTAAKTSSKYLVISPHTAEECLAALDEIVATGEGAIDNWHWGCGSGDHTGYQFTQAGSDTDALKIVPKVNREKAMAIKLNKFTAEQIASYHEMH